MHCAQNYSPGLIEFRRQVVGQKIIKLTRRAKLLIIHLDSGDCLAMHLKLTGQLVFQAPGKKLIMAGHPMNSIKEVPNKFSHVIFTFTDQTKFYFNDQRKFAYIKLLPECDIIKNGQEYGIEPLTEEFTFKHFEEVLARRPGMKMKQFLLDQTFIAGIGNIYADEVLFFSHVLPVRPIRTLSAEEKKRLYQGIKKILADAIKHGSTSYDSYAGENEDAANYNKFLKVYQREGEQCLSNDNGVIKRIKINGRSAHFCPICQK
ncbi:hypothetical protein HY224_01560 [Candidatus Uhrbacteria bacterium]|nr:hypothetical protein [Candidatus Uhrbacteria bacterium]